MAKIDPADAFGYRRMHPGLCCDCCAGYCPREDYTPSPGLLLRFTHAGRDWISDRYISIDVEALSIVPDRVEYPSPSAGLATRATGAPTGLLGDKTIELLARLPQIAVADSDVPTQHALTIDGRMVGFTMKGRNGLPIEHLPRALRMAEFIPAQIGGSPLLAASSAIIAWLATERTTNA